MSRLIQQFLFSLLLLSFMMSASAVRYLGDPKQAPAIKNLINILQVQSQEIEKVLRMLAALQNEKSGLDERKQKLGKAMQVLKADRVLVKAGKLSKSTYHEKWQEKGQEQQLQKDMDLFQNAVKKFNHSIKVFNLTAQKMKHVLKKRTPGQIAALVAEMKKLILKLQQALNEGNYEKALFIAHKSDVAKEFGYSKK